MSAPIAGPPPTAPVATGPTASPVHNPVETMPAVPWRDRITDDDLPTVLEALRSWHRSPDSALHRRALALANRIEGTTR